MQKITLFLDSHVFWVKEWKVDPDKTLGQLVFLLFLNLLEVWFGFTVMIFLNACMLQKKYGQIILKTERIWETTVCVTRVCVNLQTIYTFLMVCMQ